MSSLVFKRADNDTGSTSNEYTFQAAQRANTGTFVTALTTNIAIGGAEFLAWIILRRLIKAVYEPRTYIPPRDRQAKPLGNNLLWPIWKIIRSNPEDILTKNGVDPYLFLRFVRMLAKGLIPVWFVSWAVLMPINSVRTTNGDSEGLDVFTFGNISRDKQSRYWSHLILVCLFDLWFFYLIWVEMAHWLKIRQQYLVSPKHSKTAQASTILVTAIPRHMMDEQKLRDLFSYLPGGVKYIWLVRNLKSMPEFFDRRLKACNALESAEVQLIKAARRRLNKNAREAERLRKKGKPVPESLMAPANPTPEQGELDLAQKLVPAADRPKMRLKPKWAPFGLGFFGIGAKVDTIDHCRKEIADCTQELEVLRKRFKDDALSRGASQDFFPPLSSAFVQFNQQIAAHMAQQCVLYQEPYKMNLSYIEQSPNNVIWRNMKFNAYEVSFRRAASYAVLIGLIIAWAPMTAFVGSLASLSELTTKFKWLGWLNGTGMNKKILQGVATGLLPPALLALLTFIFPMILRVLSAFQGTVSHTEVELDVMTKYFCFLVIHVFLIVTLSAGLIKAIPEFTNNPASIPSTLATRLPRASVFFITRILLQFTGMIGNLLQPISLLLYYVRVILGGGTPRKIFNARYQMPEVQYGTDFPNLTVYACIMISYMIIAPVINGFGACFAILAYFVYKYLYIWVVDIPPGNDTGGLFFPKAITHLFVGFYIQQIAVCALFFLARNDKNKASSVPEAAIMIVLIVITAAYNYTIKKMYGPLKVHLPLSLADLSYGTAGVPISKINEIDDTRNTSDDSVTDNSGKEEESGWKPEQYQSTSKQSPDYIELAEMGGTKGRRRSMYEDDDKETDAQTYFAVPGGPGVKTSTIPVNDPNAFFHPATKEPQRTIWIPTDELGLGAWLDTGNVDHRVASTTRNAFMSNNCKVKISGPPPEP